MKQARSGRGGRPQRKPKPGERVPLGLRVTPQMKVRLDKAAEQSGRSQSQEAEFRLQQSFSNEDAVTAALGGPELRPIATIMAATFAHSGQNHAPRDWAAADWIRDQACYREAALATMEALLLSMPDPSPKEINYAIQALFTRILSRRVSDAINQTEEESEEQAEARAFVMRILYPTVSDAMNKTEESEDG
jgi:hypothetical protein